MFSTLFPQVKFTYPEDHFDDEEYEDNYDYDDEEEGILHDDEC